MIYDCFTFFNELDLLEIRLNVLKDVVDKFVLVEADRTFTNRPKKLFFEENKARFAEFSDRIIHVIVKDHPPFKTAWHYESHQRNAIIRGLTDAKPDDVVLIGDVDEIPMPAMIAAHAHKSGISVFNQIYFAYYLNFRNVRQQWWHGTKMLSYDNFCHVFDGVETIHNEMLPDDINQGTTPSKIRMRTPPRSRCKTRVIRNGGWHFTSLGGAERLAEKIKSFSHQEYNPGEDKIDLEQLEKMIVSGKGPFWEMACFGERINGHYPSYIVDNQQRYSSLIFPVSEDYLKRTFWRKVLCTSKGKAIGFAEQKCPAIFHNWLHLIKLQLASKVTHV